MYSQLQELESEVSSLKNSGDLLKLTDETQIRYQIAIKRSSFEKAADLHYEISKIKKSPEFLTKRSIEIIKRETSLLLILFVSFFHSLFLSFFLFFRFLFFFLCFSPSFFPTFFLLLTSVILNLFLYPEPFGLKTKSFHIQRNFLCGTPTPLKIDFLL